MYIDQLELAVPSDVIPVTVGRDNDYLGICQLLDDLSAYISDAGSRIDKDGLGGPNEEVGSDPLPMMVLADEEDAVTYMCYNEPG